MAGLQTPLSTLRPASRDAQPMTGGERGVLLLHCTGASPRLTLSFIESLIRSMGGNGKPEMLPEKVVSKDDRMISWWTPQQRRAMFYKTSEGKAKHLNGKVFPQPPLVWQVWEGSLRIRARIENKRPAAGTNVSGAPFWNPCQHGSGCTRAPRRPGQPSGAPRPPGRPGFF